MDELRSAYGAALKRYVADGGEAGLQHAYDLARSAIERGMGVTDVVAAHEDAVWKMLAASRSALSRTRVLESASQFLLEGLSVFEMTQRGFQEANEALRRLNQTLEQEVAERTSELRDSEERKSAILDSALDCIVTIDHEGRVIEFNPAAESTFGYSRDEVMGKGMAELIIPALMREGHAGGLAHYLATGEGPVLGKRIEMVAMRADGREFPVELAITAIRMDGPPMFTGFVRDISERKQIEAERGRLLAQTELLARRLLDVQEEERRQVAYDIHDGPAQQMVAAGMFLETYSSERKEREAAEVEEHLDRAKSYLGDAIRDTRRIISDLRPSVLDDFGLVEALRHYLSEVEDRGGCPVDFQTDMSGVRFEASAETVLFRIAQEAVTNALKHSGSERLAVSLREEPSAFVLEVRDWGAGFDLVRAIASRSGGRGVGLVSMRERAELVGGKFHLESTPGQGTTVRVEIPREKAAKPGGTQEEGVIHVPTTTLGPEIAEKNGITVLIADDHPMVRQGLHSMLNTEGIEVIGEASDGQEAVERVRELKPDVVLMDVRMPDMDGLTATEVVKEEAPSTSVIIVTGYESKDYLRRAIEVGAAGYLLKGMSRDSLIEAIKLVRGGGSLIDAKLLAELLQDMGVQGSRFQGAPEGALEALSPREQEVLQFLVGGLTNKEIARQMNYSVGTVKNVVQRVIEKLGVSDRTQAAVFAVRAGLPAASM